MLSVQVLGAAWGPYPCQNPRIHVDTSKLVSEHDALIVTSLHSVFKSLWDSQCSLSHCQPQEHVSSAGWLLCAGPMGPMAAPSDDCFWQSSGNQAAILLSRDALLHIYIL